MTQPTRRVDAVCVLGGEPDDVQLISLIEAWENLKEKFNVEATPLCDNVPIEGRIWFFIGGPLREPNHTSDFLQQEKTCVGSSS